MSDQIERRRNRQVGLFVLAAVVTALGIFFLVGSEQRLFGSTYTLHTRFSDVSGLRAGAPVRLAGMDVGTVTAVRFSDDLAKKEVQVELEVDRRFADRVRRDSVASIATQGVLGDKFISVSVGSPQAARMEAGETLPHEEPANMLESFELAAEVLENLRSITAEIDTMIKGEEGDSAQKSIQDILASVRNIIVETEQGRGILHDLVYNPQLARKLDGVLSNLSGATADLADVTNEIRDGDGTVHKLIYEDDISEAVTAFKGAATQLDGLLADVRNQNGLLYALIYDSERVELVENLEAAAEGLKRVVANIEAGEGTVGGLISDPTIYQDIKTLLGRAERNRVLKAYVRQTMKANEKEQGLETGGGEVRE